MLNYFGWIYKPEEPVVKFEELVKEEITVEKHNLKRIKANKKKKRK